MYFLKLSGSGLFEKIILFGSACAFFHGVNYLHMRGDGSYCKACHFLTLHVLTISEPDICSSNVPMMLVTIETIRKNVFAYFERFLREQSRGASFD